MGCGCRQTATSYSSITKNGRTIRRNTVNITKSPYLSPTVVEKRKHKCSQCRFAKKIIIRNIVRARKCRKTNREIDSLAKDPSFRCPAAKF